MRSSLVIFLVVTVPKFQEHADETLEKPCSAKLITTPRFHHIALEPAVIPKSPASRNRVMTILSWPKF